MNDATESELVEGLRRLRIRFSLLALFLVMTGLCVLLAWWVQPERCKVEALILLQREPPALIEDFTLRSAEQRGQNRRTMIEYAASPWIVTNALRDPAIAALPLIKSQPDQVQWVVDRLEIDYRDQSELLAIRMQGPEASANDMRQILDAVAAAYLKTVVSDEEMRKSVQYDALFKSYLKMSEELKAKIANLEDLEQSPVKDDAELQLKRMEVEELTKVWRQVSRLLQIDDINQTAPPQVRLIQPATIISE